MPVSKLLLLLALVIVCLASGNSKRALTNPTAVVLWNRVLLDAIVVVKPAPPIAARAMAIMHTAIYDAWSCYDPTAIGTRFKAFLKRPASERNDDNRQKALSYAAFRVMLDQFPTYTNGSLNLMQTLNYDPSVMSIDVTTPEGLGNVMALACLDFRYGDGSNQKGTLNTGNYSDCTNYMPVNTLDQLNNLDYWQPLNTSDGKGQKFSVPHWGNLVTFARNPFTHNLPPPVLQSNRDAFVKQSKDLLTYSAGLTDTQKMIAEFWAGGSGTVTPPGIWCQIAQFVSSRDNHNLEKDVKMFFALSGALFDAGVYAWIVKRQFDSVRPITTIRNLFKGQTVSAWAGPGKGTQNILADTWTPYLPTPPFGEYVSGHSTFSGSAAELLKSFTGSSKLGYSYTFAARSSTIEPGVTPANDVTLTFATFIEGADSAGISRRYGGIHFLAGDLQGRALGKQVGAQAWQTAQYYFRGASSTVSISMALLALLALFFF